MISFSQDLDSPSPSDESTRDDAGPVSIPTDSLLCFQGAHAIDNSNRGNELAATAITSVHSDHNASSTETNLTGFVFQGHSILQKHNNLSKSFSSQQTPDIVSKMRIGQWAGAAEPGAPFEEAEVRHSALQTQNAWVPPHLAGTTLLEITNGRNYSPPAIYISDLPADITHQAFFYLIRVPNGRIRLAQVGGQPHQTKIHFAEISGHNMFLQMAYEGLLKGPGKTPLHIRINRSEILESEGEEAMPCTTRVIRIRGLLTADMTLNGVIRDLGTASAGWQYTFEKALHVRVGQTNTFGVILLCFTGIGDAVRARQALTTAEAVAQKYKNAEVSYGHDECSTTGNPIVFLRILDKCHVVVDPKADHLTSPGGLVPVRNSAWGRYKEKPSWDLPAPKLPLSAQHEAKTSPKSLSVSMPCHVDIKTGKLPLPPFPYHRHGIFILQVPSTVAHTDVLEGIRGGKVRRVTIFRPGIHVKGTATYVAVFFTTEEAAQRVQTRAESQKGIMIPLFGKRYKSIPYCSPSKSYPRKETYSDGASRVVSITFEDLPTNENITFNYVQELVWQQAKIEIGVRNLKIITNPQALSASGTSTPVTMKTMIVETSCIIAAMQVKGVLYQIKVVGSTRIIRYELDPCDGPVEQMA